MMKPAVPAFAAVLACLALLPASGADKSKDRTLARGITQTHFQSWSEALALESHDVQPKAVVVPAFGGRVLSYGLRGENLLWTDPTSTPATPPTGTNAAYAVGGFGCTLGPESARLPVEPALASGAYDFSVRKGGLVVMKSAEDKTANAQLEREILFDPATGDLGFVHRLKNLSERDATYTLWHRIACQPGGYVLAPINKKSRFPAGWSVRVEKNGKFAYDSAQPQVEGVRVMDGVLVAKTGTGGAKVGLDGDAQWLAYALGRTLFVIHLPYYSASVYAEGGNSLTFSWNERFTELQPMGPEARIRSRRTADLPMKWSLVELPAEITSFEAARALAEKIPPSPFQ